MQLWLVHFREQMATAVHHVRDTASDACFVHLQLDFAARRKSDSKLQETYQETVKRFGDVISSLG